MDATARTAEPDWKSFWIPVGIAALIGVIVALLNADLPILRNAFTYAKGAVGIVDSGFDILRIAGDATWTAGRPIFFSLLAAPLVAMFGVNLGMVLASTVGSLFFLWMLLLCVRRFSAQRQTIAPLAIVFTVANPLVIYQFWSGYPDSLFAGLVLLALILVDLIAASAQRDTRWHIVGLGAVMFIAIHTKLYGAILGLVCPLYVLMHWRTLRGSVHARSKLVIGVAVLLLLATLLVLAKLELNPLLRLEDGSGLKLYVEGLSQGGWKAAWVALRFYLFTLVLLFHFALIFLVSRGAWHAVRSPVIMFVAVYVAGLVMFPGALANMRYLIPVFPILGIAMAVGASKFSRGRCAIVLAVYALVAMVFTLTFNVRSVNARFGASIAASVAALFGPVDAPIFLDNLRLPAHLELKNRIDFVNAEVPAGSVLYWASDYYGTATHEMGERIGLKPGLLIRYVHSPSQIAPQTEPVFLTGLFLTELKDVPRWARVDDLGRGVFRLAPSDLGCLTEGAECGAAPGSGR